MVSFCAVQYIYNLQGKLTTVAFVTIANILQ